ncbi:MAG: DUF4870 domain-containing protein [Hamadaea sp.]|uniref:DUF4870 domain-containing protein n=1 Tax=Hamadaea sp. TaxID=2024425 RepID=UPI00179003A5|nr:DUF4870 domain-containing protein [Hamadaea sp.]NUR70665.1 DUF4870 domain-containing protein [Hamadaea sp.]NUT17852.1 DUF4870 domain-containing protein [Hamadaea sp.]
MSETPTPPGTPDPEPPAAPQYDAPPPPPVTGSTPPVADSTPVTGQVAPTGFANQDEKMWALIAHFGGAGAAVVSGGWLGWVPPLIAMLVKGNESPTVRAHALAALNFQGLWAIISVLSYVLFCAIIGFITLPIAIIIAAVFGVIAGLKANEGAFYSYPLSVNVIK